MKTFRIRLLLAICALSLADSGYCQSEANSVDLEFDRGRSEVEEDSVRPTVEGAQLYDLPGAIQKAIAISPALDAAQFEKEAAEAQYADAKYAALLPKFETNAFGGYVPDVPPGSGPEGNFPNVQFSWADMGPFVQLRTEIFQPIYTFGKLASLRKAALAGIEARNEGIEKARNELILQVKRAYIGLTTLYSFREFITELKNRADKARELIQKKIAQKSPDVTDIDLMRVNVFEAETERRLIEIENGVQFTMMTLKVLMGVPREIPIDIVDQHLKMDDTEIAPIENYILVAKDSRPEIAQLTHLVEVREAAMEGAKANFFPTLGIFGFYNYGYAPNRQSVNNPFLVEQFNLNSGGASLALNQKLNFWTTHVRYKQAKAMYQKAKSDQDRALQGIEIEIRKAHANALAKQQAVESAKRGYKAGRSWVLASTLNFGIGVGPPKDLLEAFVGYSTVRVNYLQTLNDYHVAVAELSNAIGKEVTKLQY